MHKDIRERSLEQDHDTVQFSKFEKQYQSLYTEARDVIRQIASSLFCDLEDHCKGDGWKKYITTKEYNIQD